MALNRPKGLTIIESIWNFGDLPYLVANIYGANCSKIRGIWFFRGDRSPLFEGLTIIERSVNYGNLPYSVANTYGLNFIKIGGIWIFRGQKPPIRGVTFDMWCPFSNSNELFQSKVMCENLVWIGWNRRYVNFQGGQKPPIRGVYMWPAMPIFELVRAISVKTRVKIWIGWAFQ